MRAWGLSLVLIGSLSPALAEDAPPAIAVTVPAASTAPYDVVRQFIDIQVMEDGSYLKGEELAYRVRDAQGVTALQQVTLSFTQGFQDYRVVSAYTLKADGARIEVPRERMLLGHGASSLPGFQDENNLTIFFPNVEIGDQVVLRTIFRQDIPWYEGNFAATFPFTRTVVVEQARLQVSAPSDLPVMISSTGMQGGAEQIIDGQKRWIWTYSNDLPLNFAQDSVVEIDADPHVALTTFANYAEVAEAYAERSEDKSAVTPEIQALADALTEGVTDEREQVRILYHWVASQISYVAIFLGAGGFTPHEAGEILANRYGDCKDHVVLLEALLAAKGIESTAVLINLGSEYEILDTPSPFYFNHVITYVPSIDLYLDSTSPMAPFGVLPFADSGKPVVHVNNGLRTVTPLPTSADSSMRAETMLEIRADGSATGTTRISANGSGEIDLRGLVDSLPAGRDSEHFSAVMGPGVTGTIERFDPRNLDEPYLYQASYTIPDAVFFPGPGALPTYIFYKPFSFSFQIGGEFPAERYSDYLCPLMGLEEDATVRFPEGTNITAVPRPVDASTEGVALRVSYERVDERTVRRISTLAFDRPSLVCSIEYYARVRPDLARMLASLRAQIIYE